MSASGISPGTTRPQGPGPTDSLRWREVLAPYQVPTVGRSLWQVVNTLVPYALLWYLMYRSLAVSYWITLLLAVLAAGFLVRVFIIFHDCAHGSFFRSRKAADVLGFILGGLTFTPFCQWRRTHALHHASAGDLDRRGLGDVWTLTVQEYLQAPRRKRFAYRLARNPAGFASDDISGSPTRYGPVTPHPERRSQEAACARDLRTPREALFSQGKSGNRARAAFLPGCLQPRSHSIAETSPATAARRSQGRRGSDPDSL